MSFSLPSFPFGRRSFRRSSLALKLLAPVALTALGAACGGAPAKSANSALLASDYAASSGETNPKRLGDALMAEMFLPGGTAKRAADVRKQLGTIKPDGASSTESLATAFAAAAIYDEAHGDPAGAADGYVQAMFAAARSFEPSDQLVAWFAAQHAASLHGSVLGLYRKHAAQLDALMKAPNNLGWRAYSVLAEWNVAETYKDGGLTGDTYERYVAGITGCAKGIRLAGPFGHGAARDRHRAFKAEKAGPWPRTFSKDPERGSIPHLLKSEQPRCLAASTERAEEGVFYSENFFQTKSPRDLLIAVQGAFAVWVDDKLVMERDPSNWGDWQRYGASVHVGEGRHRVVAKLLSDSTIVRILETDGRKAEVSTEANPEGASADTAQPYGLSGAAAAPDQNPLDTYVHSTLIPPLVRPFAAYGAHVDGLDDVASSWMDPLVTEGNAAPLALEYTALYARNDSAFTEEGRKRAEKALHGRAAAADPALWYSRVWLALESTDQRGAVDAVEPMRKLAADAPGQPEVQEQLARLYGRLGWRAERMDTLKAVVTRFPENESGLKALAQAYEDDGTLADADAIAARIQKLDPDSDLVLSRALARQDYKAAIAELERMKRRRPERKDVAGKVADVLRKSGDPSAAVKILAEALAKSPQDSELRLRVADSKFANGDKRALRIALAEAIAAGSKGRAIREAAELIEGVSNLEPYRQDSFKVIAAFEAWEKSGHHMDGSAARVLDYSTLWVNPDGSSQMLEHEIQKIQSQEAIGAEAEQEPPTGVTLRMRVIKPGGIVLEPEQVAGKQTLTLPHLEVGDYLDIEHITETGGDSKGLRYRGPHWFFREADKGYWRSEFVTLTPKDKTLLLETRGSVPAPVEKDHVFYTERRWLVQESPPATEEPSSPPVSEFLPSVRVGWGDSFASGILRAIDATLDETPRDPRVAKRIFELVVKIPAAHKEERARIVYRDIVSKIEEGKESDGRRVLTGKSGSRQAAFVYAMKLLEIPVQYAVVKNRLAAAPMSALSEADPWDSVLLRLTTERGPKWLTVHDKFAPFGYVPADLRGQPAIVLTDGAPKETTEASGAADGLAVEGRIDVQADGKALCELREVFSGKVAIAMRNVLDQLPKEKLADFAETRLLAGNLPGARVRDVQVENAADPDAPLVLKIRVEATDLVRKTGTKGLLKALFPARVTSLSALPARQTPMLIGGSSHLRVKLQVVFPEATKMPASLETKTLTNGDRTVTVKDSVNGHALTLDREVSVPAGRVDAGEPYLQFARFARSADALLEAEIAVDGL